MKNINLETYFSKALSVNIGQAINDVTDLLAENVQQLKLQYEVEDRYHVGESNVLRFVDQKDMICHHLLLLESILDQLMIDDWYAAEPWPIRDHRSEIMNVEQVMTLISDQLETTEFEAIPIRTLILQVIDQNASIIINHYRALRFGEAYTQEVLLEQLKQEIKMDNISLQCTAKSIKFIRPTTFSRYNTLTMTVELIFLVLQISRKIDCQQDLELLRNGFQLDEVTCSNAWLKSIKFYQNGSALLTCRSEVTKDSLLLLFHELGSFKYAD